MNESGTIEEEVEPMAALPRHPPANTKRLAAKKSPPRSPIRSSARLRSSKRSPMRRASAIPRKSCLHRFSVLVSTEQNHGIATNDFYGPYAHLRKQLDYDYHTNYRKDRQWLQDSIIEDMLDNVSDTALCTNPTEPWFIQTVGAQGAGKRHTIMELAQKNHLPLLTFVYVDPDEIRRRLPEYGTYVEKIPFMVEALTKKECGYIAELLTFAALQSGRNVVVDSGIQDANWHRDRLKSLKEEYPSLKFALFYISAPFDVIAQRIEKKKAETGREIADECALQCVNDIPSQLEIVRPVVDFYCEISNGESCCELVDEEIDWQQFERNFLQTCAWMPGKKKRDLSEMETKQIESTLTSCMMSRHRQFSTSLSSEENNKADNLNFYGQFSHIRKTLDYNYHCNYTFERQKLQDAIIADMLDGAIVSGIDGKVGSVPKVPFIVWTAGAMGAGKSYTMNNLVENGHFPLLAFIIVDPDEIRRLLPEYQMYIEYDPEIAGEMTRKEAGFIAEILTLAALQGGKNVLQDGSLRDSGWYQVYFARLREEFPNLRQAIIHVTAPREAIFERAEARAKETGRVVPRKVLEAALDQVPKSIKILSPLVDYYAEIENAPDTPCVKLVKPDGETWENFEKQWQQELAYVPSRRKFLAKAKQMDEKLGVGSALKVKQ